MSTQKPLGDSVALITGASSGIGEETCRELARDGADVVLVARREERLERLATEIESEYGVEALVAPADVSEEPAVAAAVEMTINRFGQLDIVVSNAGVAGSDNQSISEIDMESYRAVIGVNIDGAFHVARNTVPHLTKTAGSLIFVGSFDGLYPRPRSPTYAASKWWLRGFAHSLSGPLGEKDIGVTVVNPAKVRTEIGRAGEPSFKERFEEGEILEPTDVAKAIAFAAHQPPRATVSELDLFTRDKYSREGF